MLFHMQFEAMSNIHDFILKSDAGPTNTSHRLGNVVEE